MQEFDENKAIELMAATLGADRRDEDAVFEVLDLIFDYYDENGDLDIDLNDDDDDDETDVEAMTAYISKYLAKHPAPVRFTADEIKAMIEAELAYEESLI